MTVPATACTFHPDRRAGVSCQRCGRPICPDCMVTASVGFHCPECARAGSQQVYGRHDLAAQRDPIVTKVLIGINALAFLLTGLGGDTAGAARDLFEEGLLVGMALSREMELMGVDDGEWYRIITGGFLHANLLHVGFNMFLLWMLGSMLEPAFGRLRFGLLYAVSLLAGSFGVLLVDPLQPTVGASGAVFGLMGATVVAQRASGINPWQSGIGGLVLINLLFTFAVPNISIGGHLGGLVGGAVVGGLLVELPSRLPGRDRQSALAVASVLVVLFGLACVLGSFWAAGQWPSRV